MASKQSTLEGLHAWHQTPVGLFAFAVIELVAAYIFGSLAIDTGSYWHYGLAILFVVGGVHNVVKLVPHFRRKK